MTDTLRYWEAVADQAAPLQLGFDLCAALVEWLDNPRVRWGRTISYDGVAWHFDVWSPCWEMSDDTLMVRLEARQGRRVLRLQYLGHPRTETAARPHRIVELLERAAADMGAGFEVSAIEEYELPLWHLPCVHLPREGSDDLQACKGAPQLWTARLDARMDLSTQAPTA